MTSSLTFGGSPSFSLFEGKLNLLLDNDRESGLAMRIYGISQTPQIVVSSSDLIGSTSEGNVTSHNIYFNGYNSLSIKNISKTTPTLVNIRIDGQHPGLYSGTWLIEGQYSVSVPLTLDVKSDWVQSLILVIDGIALSIIIWKLVKYLNDKLEIQRQLQQNQAALLAEANLTNVPTRRNRRGVIVIDTFQLYLSKKRITEGIVIKDLILNFFSMIFGILVGILALFNEDFFTGIRSLGAHEILLLLLVGLGIGSLKEYVFEK